MNQQPLELRASCLRRYVGLRINLFRAMHDGRFFVADDLAVLAARIGEHALTACVAFDPALSCHYVVECRWYASDLTQLPDEDVPSGVRQELLHQFVSVLG
jgi:hypothetical protein